MNFNLKNCLADCYNGFSSMKGEKTGLAKQINLEELKALLTHWFTHSLNLAVGDAIKANRVVKNSFKTTFEIKLIKKSPKRDGKLKDIKTVIEQEKVSDIY